MSAALGHEIIVGIIVDLPGHPQPRRGRDKELLQGPTKGVGEILDDISNHIWRDGG
jgi:hypothetical protein